MNKITVLLAMMAVCFASCQRPVLDEQIIEADSFTASVEDFCSQTKTFMNSSKRLLWSEGDRLAIFRGASTADEYRLTDESAGSANGTFIWVDGQVSFNFAVGTMNKYGAAKVGVHVVAVDANGKVSQYVTSEFSVDKWVEPTE